MNTNFYSEPATHWMSKDEAFAELQHLKFSVSAMVSLTKQGSYERELADNAKRGIARRIDYLHDSLTRLMAEQPK